MVGMQVKTVARIVEGDAGKAICKEAEKLKPVALIMGTRGRSLIKRYICLSLFGLFRTFRIKFVQFCDPWTNG